MTTKKDFIFTAKTVAAMLNREDAKKAAEVFCKVYSEQNPRFDKERFLKACKC